MTDATGNTIRELEIIIILIDIETVYIRTRPCLTVLDHVWIVLKPYWSYGDCLKTYVHIREVYFIYDCIYRLIRSHTLSHGLVRPLLRSYTDMTSVPGFFKVLKPYKAFTDTLEWPRIRPRLVRLHVRFTRVANRVSRMFCVKKALAKTIDLTRSSRTLYISKSISFTLVKLHALTKNNSKFYMSNMSSNWKTGLFQENVVFRKQAWIWK